MSDNTQHNYEQDKADAERERMSYKEYISLRAEYRQRFPVPEVAAEKFSRYLWVRNNYHH